MDDEAKVTNNDGDKVSHGWSLLDIVKHAACTYVQSLGAADFLCVVTYASDVKVVCNWQACTDDGKKELNDAIRGLKTEGLTNLSGGIRSGFDLFGKLPEQVAAAPHEYAMLLAVCTDGNPTASTHPNG